MLNMEVELSEVRLQATEVIVRAGSLLKKEFEKVSDDEVRIGAIERIEAADEASDKLLRENLKRLYPQSEFLTETTTPSEYKKVQSSPWLWIIDSLDGRINFSRKHPNFVISVALSNGSAVRLGLIHFPLSGQTFWAQEGIEGAFLDNDPILVSGVRHMKDALIALDWPYNLKQRETVVEWAGSFAPKIRQIKSTGSAAADLAMVAAGRIDAYVQLGTKPWDVAAGGLLVRKAGGKVTTPENEAWDPFNDRIFASNGILHQPILNLINR